MTCGLTPNEPYSYRQDVTIKGGQSVELKDASGNALLFPVGTHCWATEPGTGGATSSRVDHDSFDEAAVVAPAPDGVQSLVIAATNEYTYAGFTVTKSVVTTGAKDADGTLVVYTPSFTFRTTCSLAGTTWTLADTFTLSKQGDTWGSKAYDHLPTGATCTITETGTGGASSTTVQVTQDGVTGQPSNSAVTSVTLVKGEASATVAAFTNTYAVGKATIAKVLAGDGTQWATAPFSVRLTCTTSFTTPATVYDKTFAFSAGSLGPVLIENLPHRATCTVSEPVTGGANTFTPTNVTIGNGTTVAAKATNTFSTGGVTVTKALRVNGQATTAEPWASGSYTVTLHCTRVVDGVTETLAVPDATQVLTGAGSHTWTKLPTGATCWASEDGVAYPAGTPGQPEPAVSLNQPTVTVTTGTATQTLTNDFGFGGLQIVKHLTGEAAARYATGTFTFDVACTLDGFTGNVFTRSGIALRRNDAETTLTSPMISPIPQGATCTVTESGTAGATAVTPSSRSVTPPAIQAGETRTATFANEFRYAGFTVSKVVDNGDAIDQDGDSVPYAGAYTFAASCRFNGAEVIPEDARTFTLTKQPGGAWSTRTFAELPAGSSCTVTEVGRAGAAETAVQVQRHWDRIVDATATSTGAFDLVDDPTDPALTKVTFINRYRTGRLRISKETAGAGSERWGTGTFTVALDCTLDNDADPATDPIPVYAAQKQLAAGGSWLVNRLPAGARCAVTEPKPAGASATAIDNGTPTVVAAGEQAVTVTNTFATGSVRVSKALTVNGTPTTAEPWASGTYTMRLTCTRDFDDDGAAETLALDDPVKTVTGAGTATWTDLPQGAECSVTETGVDYPEHTPDQPKPTSTTYSAPVTVGNATVVPLTVTNDFAHGSLRIAKQLTGPAAAQYATAAFSFDVGCTLAGFDGEVFSRTVTLRRGGAETALDSGLIGPIPQGAVCAVTETGSGGATSVSPSSKRVTLTPIVAGESRSAEFSNTFEFAGFTVTKTIDDGGARTAGNTPVPYAGTYSFTASCQFNDAEVLAEADRAFTLTGGKSRAFSGLPSGASCTVTETRTAGAADTRAVVTQGGDTITDTRSTQATFTLVTGDATATAVGFTNRYTTGGLDITKRVSGAGASLWGGGTFTVGVVCTFDHDANPATVAISVYNSSQTLQKDQTWAVRNLPTGARCSLTEPKQAGAFSWSFSPANPTITTANQAITLTNSFPVGSVRVAKVLRANGLATSAEPWASGTFPVTLVCTRDFDNDGTPRASRSRTQPRRSPGRAPRPGTTCPRARSARSWRARRTWRPSRNRA